MIRGPVPLQAVLPSDLAQSTGIDLVDARRIVSLVHRTGRLPERSPATIRRAALDAVRAYGHVPSLARIERRTSGEDPFVKYAFELGDGGVIETVRVPLERAGRFAVCVSSQVGCALGCVFCATGRLGLGAQPRDLGGRRASARDSLRTFRRGRRIHGVLFQGMGEPLANTERVIAAIRVLADPSAEAIDMRNITVCTAGLPRGIRPWRVRCRQFGWASPSGRSCRPSAAVSCPSTKPIRSTRCSPLRASMRQRPGLRRCSPTPCSRATTTVTCTLPRSRKLAQDFALRYGIRPRLSLIPYNAIAEAGLLRSTRLDAFRAVLRARQVGTIVRLLGRRGHWCRLWTARLVFPDCRRQPQRVDFCLVTSLVARLRPYAGVLAFVAAAAAWGFAFLWGWAGMDWRAAVDAGSITPLRGSRVTIWNSPVETDAEREARERKIHLGIGAALKAVEKEVLGNRSKIAGNDIPIFLPEIPYEREELSRHEYCNKIRLLAPEQSEGLKCDDPELDDR